MKVLNWYSDDESFIEGLLELFTEPPSSPGQGFRTIRLGIKWADMLNPGDLVAISITKDLGEDLFRPNIIGYARVQMTHKGTPRLFKSRRASLRQNIGAKTWNQVVEDMNSIYDPQGKTVSLDSSISVLDLIPEVATNCAGPPKGP